MAVRWHALAPEALAHEFRSSLDTGMSEEEARRRLMEQGPNGLPEVPAVSCFALFPAQFSSLIIWVLIVAAIVSDLLQQWVDTAAILAIVILNAVLGFVQEFKAE